jgi:hypothetical protein
MNAEELTAFVAEVRAQVDELVARLEALDPDALPPDLRRMHADVRRQADELRTLTDAHVVALLEDACLGAGRELTPDELRGLLRRQ